MTKCGIREAYLDSFIFHFQERLLEAGYKKSISELSSASFWPSFIFGDTLRIVFQNLLLETNEDILQCSERVWNLLVQVYHLKREIEENVFD